MIAPKTCVDRIRVNCECAELGGLPAFAGLAGLAGLVGLAALDGLGLAELAGPAWLAGLAWMAKLAVVASSTGFRHRLTEAARQCMAFKLF